MQGIILILLALAGAAVAMPLLRAGRRRRRRFASLALRRGWTYGSADPWDLPRELATTWLGTWGHDRRCSDVFTVQTPDGVLWLATFGRQMASGRRRRDERYLLAMITMNEPSGGVAILPARWQFTSAGSFEHYRTLENANGQRSAGVQIWAERPDSERSRIMRLVDLTGQSGQSAVVEMRGRTAVIYFPIRQSPAEQDYLDLVAAGRELLAVVAPIQSPDAAGDDITAPVGRESP